MSANSWIDLPDHLATALEETRAMGKKYLRPLGLEADKRGGPHPPDHAFYRWYAESGKMGATVEADLSGDRFAGDRWAARRMVVTMEETSYWDRGMAVSLPGPGLGGPTVMAIGTPAQQKRFLHPFLDRSRPRWAAFGMTEPGAGSDVARIATRCEKRGDQWVLNGAKAFCSNSPRADWVIIYATIDPKLGRAGHRVFAVPPSTPGFTTPRLERKMGLKAYETASFELEDCVVPADHLLGGEQAYGEDRGKAGFTSAMKAFDFSRPGMAAMAIGIGRAAYEHARDWVVQHDMISRPVPRVQRIIDRLADMERKLRAGFLLCWKAASLLDLGERASLQASLSKAYCAPVALEACSMAMDILGEAGIAKDHFVEKLFRDAKALDIIEGTGQVQRIIIARHLLGLPGS
ncbi:MAG: acyl-CoA dehydrogenase family protein [Kofleriaceae bacterium]